MSTININISKVDLSLDQVDNTSDLNKPISTATQTALDTKVDENAPITGATKTKITYDAKGLVTSGADATTADIADSTNKRYVTDAELTDIGYLNGVASSVQNQLNAKVNLNTLITPASGNKVSVDAKGLVLSVTDEYATSTTGSAISFSSPKVWNTFSSPSTANLTDDLTGAKIGAIQKIYSNKAVAPTVPAGWVLIGTGTYTTSTLNIIFAEWVSGTRVEYWITKPA